MKKIIKGILIVFLILTLSLVSAIIYFSVKGSDYVSNGNVSAQSGEQGNTQEDGQSQDAQVVQQGTATNNGASSQNGATASDGKGSANSAGIVEKEISFTTKNNDPRSGNYDFEAIAVKYANEIAAIENGYKGLQMDIDLSSFTLTHTDLRNIITYLKTNHGYYYVANAFNYSHIDGIVQKYSPGYTMSAGDIQKYDKQIADIVSKAANEAGKFKTDVEKLIYIHDFIIANTTYNPSAPAEQNSIYGALILKNTMCTGYSEAFAEIASKLVIKTYIVKSDKLNHAWNLVLLDGRYYHIDCAWDDPTISNQNLLNNPVSGFGRYLNFLCSEKQLYKDDHISNDWLINGVSVSGAASSTFYDGFFWRDYNTLMKYSNGSWYQSYSFDSTSSNPADVKFCIDKITFTNNDNYKLSACRTIYTHWSMGSSFYPMFYSTLQGYNGSVYYIKADGIYKLKDGAKADGSGDPCVFKNPRNDNIYDFAIDASNGTFTVMYGKTADNTSSNATKLSYKLADYSF